MKALILIFALVVLIAAPLRAELSQYRGRYKMAMEIELTPEQAKALTPLFDWKKVERDIADGTFKPFPETREQLAALGKPLDQAPPGLLTELMLQAMINVKNYPPLKSELVGKEGPLREVVWSRDGMKLEFAFAEPTQDPAEYLARLNRFAKAVDIQKKLQKPQDKALGELSFHVHVSRNDGTNLRSRVSALNKLVLMRMVNQDVAGELFDGSRTSRYYDNVDLRGVVRIIGPDDHFELRRHTGDPESEINELLRWLDMPEAEALAEMRRSTESLMTGKNIDALLGHSVVAAISVLSGAKPGLSDPRLAKALSAAIGGNNIREIAGALELLEKRALEGSADARALLKKAADEIQDKIKSMPLEEWLAKGPADLLLEILKVSSKYSERPDTINPRSSVLGPALDKNMRKKEVPPTTTELVRFLARDNPAVRTVAFSQLKQGNLKNEVARTFLLALGAAHLGSAEGWPVMKAIMASGNVPLLDAADHLATFDPEFTEAQAKEISLAVIKAEARAAGKIEPPTTPSSSNPLSNFSRHCQKAGAR